MTHPDFEFKILIKYLILPSFIPFKIFLKYKYSLNLKKEGQCEQAHNLVFFYNRK